MNISAAAFKAECLKLMDQVAKTRQPVVITKHGRPVAQLVPIAVSEKSLFGFMKNSVTIRGDVMAPTDASWSVLSGDEHSLYNGRASPLRNAPRKGRRVRSD